MSAFVTRKSLLFVVLVALFGLFLGLSSSSTVNAGHECELYGECGPCEFMYECDPCYPFGCGPCEFMYDCMPDPCEMFGDCDPCEVGFGDCDPCELFGDCDPCQMSRSKCDPCEMSLLECEPDDGEEEPVVDVPAAASDAPDAVACHTGTSSMEVTDRGTVVIYGTAEGGTKGTLFIAEIPLSAIRHITEAERASGQAIWILSYDSPIVEGWHIDIYWQNEYYGAHIVGNGGAFVDDTGATCGL